MRLREPLYKILGVAARQCHDSGGRWGVDDRVSIIRGKGTLALATGCQTEGIPATEKII